MSTVAHNTSHLSSEGQFYYKNVALQNLGYIHQYFTQSPSPSHWLFLSDPRTNPNMWRQDPADKWIRERTVDPHGITMDFEYR